jgi:outer membrane lipoprotein-sorting protein
MKKLAIFLLFFLLLFIGCANKINENENIEKKMAENDEKKIGNENVTGNYSNQTADQQLIIYEAPNTINIEGIKEYKPFEIIEINEKNASISLVDFEQVNSLQADLYETLSNNTSLFYPNVTYYPKENESVYLATFAYVINLSNNSQVPENVCFRKHDNPITATYCFIIPAALPIDLITGLGNAVVLTLQIGLSIFSSEELAFDIIDENKKRYPATYHAYEISNISVNDTFITSYKDYWLIGFQDKIIGKGSYAFIVPKDIKPKYVYVYLRKKGLFSLFESGKEKQIGIIKIG